MTLTPLEERIGRLCSRAIQETDPDAFHEVVTELRAALHLQLAQLRGMVDEARHTLSDIPADKPVANVQPGRRKVG